MYLMDVNALLALSVREHEFHSRTAFWVKKLPATDSLASCAITELGLLRVLLQVSWFGFSMAQGKRLLGELKNAEDLRWLFLEDNRSAVELPRWVTRPKQITDGHLLGLARTHGGILATLDKGIPGAFLIPD
jgi:uncharacterized protein